MPELQQCSPYPSSALRRFTTGHAAALGILLLAAGCGDADPVAPINSGGGGATPNATAGAGAGGEGVTGGSGGLAGGGLGGAPMGGAQAAGAAGSAGAGGAIGGSGGSTAGADAGGAGGTAGDTGAGGTDLGGAAGSAGAAGGEGGAGMVEEVSPGVKFYNDVCVGCHGADGEGTDIGPEVQHPPEGFAIFAIRGGRIAGDTTMPPYGEEALSEEVLQDLLAYLNEPPQPTDGEGLYLDYCANCHGADALGGRTGFGLRNETGRFPMDVRNGHHGGDYGHEHYMPSWTAEELSDAEIQLIAGHVSSL